MLDKYLWALFYAASLDGLGLPEDGSITLGVPELISTMA